MDRRRLVVIGASAGGVEALRALVAGLPADLGAPVLVVLHTPSAGVSVLPAILDRAGPLPAGTVTHGEFLRAGRVYAAPTDHHLTVEGGRAVLSRGPRENGHRPAIDPLFRSAVRSTGAATVGVVLSGMLDDGAAGLAAIARHGGATLVQDPAEARHAGMPLAALRAVPSAQVGATAKLGGLIAERVADRPAATRPAIDPLLDRETAIARLDPDELNDPVRPGEPAGLTCPDCDGPLFGVEESGLTRFRCRVGHAWSTESLLERQDESMESALWTALRTVEDKAALHHRLGDLATRHGAERLAARHVRAAAELARSAGAIRDLLAVGPASEPPGDGDP